MGAYLRRRLAWLLPSFLGITLIVFLAVRLAPGDPALREGFDPSSGAPSAADLERFRSEHLLDRPLLVQYLHFLGPFDLSPRGQRWFGGSGEHPWSGLLALDLGTEFRRPHVHIAQELGRRLAVTAPLALCAGLFAFAIAIPLGAWSAVRRGHKRERGVALLLFTLHSIPGFWLALLLVLGFGASGLSWLPVLGLHSAGASELSGWEWTLDLVRHSILPVLALALGSLAYLARQVRGSMLEALAQEYVITARSKGLPERVVILRHALRNALLPTITLAVMILPALVGGSVIVETIFGIPGMGRYAYEALLERDYAVIQAVTALSAFVTLLALLFADVCYAWADPRIRHG
ncbi:MAG: ABC transporter permease [Planctomycetes bacterium]|nr:ABC transporter permease [Planctomycetota bacterium]